MFETVLKHGMEILLFKAIRQSLLDILRFFSPDIGLYLTKLDSDTSRSPCQSRVTPHRLQS